MKRYVLPTIKVLIALVIAVALTKIAFFPSQASDDATADITPGYEVVTPTVTVSTGDIANTVDVTGQIVSDAASEAKATLSGAVDSFAVDPGATVAAGDPLLYLKKTEPQQPTTSTDAEGNVTTKEVPDKVTWGTVYAPVAGKVSFQVIKNQDTTVGMTVATVSPGTYSAVGTITAAQQYKLTNPPSTARVTVEGGPAPFECTGLTIGVKETKPAEGAATTDVTPQDGTRVQVRCPVPADQTVFPGLALKIGIDQGSATGTLLVPMTAVEGTAGTGNVWVVTDATKPEAAEKRSVTLGINDGTNVQVTEGLAEGDTILQFVPNKDVKRTGEPNTCEPDGSVCYDENGEETL